jgi:dimethylargininase
MFRYTHAIVRKPGKNFADGITDSGLEKPVFEKALKQHIAYCEALKYCGLELTILEADEKYPDGCFVEDAAVVTEKVAIITNPGAETRRGEVEKIAETLSKFKKTEFISLDGYVEGGDVMNVGNNYYIGISNRTNEKGGRQLSEILTNYGYSTSFIPVNTILHLKTGITHIGQNNFIATGAFADSFKQFNVIQTDQDEVYTANSLRINDFLLIPKGYPKTKNQVIKLGYQIIEIEMSEFRKMNGGLTCLSLLF